MPPLSTIIIFRYFIKAVFINLIINLVEMKLHLLDRASQDNRSFSVSHNCYPYFLKIWHYHPELELVYIIKSSGTHFIGDTIERFNVGDLILIGKNLPHMWLNDESYFEEESSQMAEALAVHFKRDFLGEPFLIAPENQKVNQLIERATRGIKFMNVEKTVIKNIKSLMTLSPFKRMVQFIELLDILANHKDIQVLTSSNYFNTFSKTNNKRLDKIYEFVYKNFRNSINSKDVANHIGMNSSAFSRYFKRIHRKTFTTYLNEIRIGYACKLLLENDVNITAIGYESGFNNLSNFNRQFKAITKLSPTKYIHIYTQNEI